MSFKISPKPIEVIRTGVKVGVIGDCFVDVVASNVDKLPQWGHNSLASAFSQHTGGSSGNVASHIGTFLSKLNTIDEFAASMRDSIIKNAYPSPLYITSVGTDDFGHFFLEKLQSRKVDTSHTQVFTDHPTGGCIVLSSTNDRSFISCLGTNDHFSVDYLLQPHILDALSACEHIHISNFLGLPSLHRRTSSGKDFVDFLVEIRQRNPSISISIDPQHANNGLWLGEDNILLRVLPEIDIFLPNDIEVMKVANASIAAMNTGSELPLTPNTKVVPEKDLCLVDYIVNAEAPTTPQPHHPSNPSSSPTSPCPPSAPAAASPARTISLTPTLITSPQRTQPLTAIQAASARVLRCMRVGGMVVVTEGADGAVAYVRGEERQDKGVDIVLVHAVKMPAYPVQLIDSTGGGDAFEAAFLLALLTLTSPTQPSSAAQTPVDALPALPAPAVALSALPVHVVLAALPLSLAAGCASGAIRVTRVSGSDHCPSWGDVCRLIATADAQSIPAVTTDDGVVTEHDASGFIGGVSFLKGQVNAKL